jgi:DNA primase
MSISSIWLMILIFLLNVMVGYESLSFSVKNVLKMGIKEKVNFIQQKISLSSIVSRFADLTPSGPDSYRCLCPFHDDRNPSMLVNEGPGYYYCFSCGATGTAVNFVAFKKNITFPESLNKLVSLVNTEDELFR